MELITVIIIARVQQMAGGHQVQWRWVSSLKSDLLVEVYFSTLKLVNSTFTDGGNWQITF